MTETEAEVIGFHVCWNSGLSCHYIKIYNKGHITWRSTQYFKTIYRFRFCFFPLDGGAKCQAKIASEMATATLRSNGFGGFDFISSSPKTLYCDNIQ